MIKAVIIDDERNSRELLQNMLTNYIEGIEIVGLGIDVPSGIEIIQQTSPEVVFLDIEMPGGNGFDILNAFSNIDFKVVFVTGYDHYAIRAIKYAALDYILKPVNLEELETTIKRLSTLKINQTSQVQFLQNQFALPSKESEQIIISGLQEYNILSLDDILYIEAEGRYVFFYIDQEGKKIASQTLNYYEDLLPSSRFFRIHKSYIANCSKVKQIDPGRTGNVRMLNNDTLPIAARRKKAFMEIMKNFK